MQMDTGEELIPHKNTLYENAALQTYKRGLMRHGRLGEMIYLKDPDSLEAAMTDVPKYQNWQYRCGISTAPQHVHKPLQQYKIS
ncbi:hypothetical protein QE152_g27187 [Popillia japonica]|uniref:Uncharacterized protein n=1 Tax=Popillia japonica TaxID=7064 RepID=A0AAW1JW37_POPJA